MLGYCILWSPFQMLKIMNSIKFEGLGLDYVIYNGIFRAFQTVCFVTT